MASSLSRLLRGSKNCYFPRATLRQIFRSGSSGSGSNGDGKPFEFPPKTPPIADASGPEFVDRGWKDDGFGLGDYPNLPPISAHDKDPYQTYWDQQDRRNFGEPLHVEEDALSRWMYDSTTNEIYTLGRMVFQLSVAFGIIGAVIFVGEIYDSYNESPLAEKEYPYDNLYLELGGDPNKDPSTQPRRKILQSPYGG